MFGSLILATALTAQVTYLPPMTPWQLQEYKIREGYTPLKSIETPRLKALQRKYDGWNSRQRSVATMRFTLPGAIRYGWRYGMLHQGRR